jgi:type IV pilus assembly protein PilC
MVVGLLLLLLVLQANHLLPASVSGWLSDRFHLPFGRRTSVARLCRFTADLLEAGVAAPDALRISGFAVEQPRVRRAAWRLANELEAGKQRMTGIAGGPLTAAVAYALAADITPAARVRLLREISGCHAERVRMGLSWTTGIVEPIAILVVGCAVGFTVLALFIPLVKLVEGLAK